jgi:hypothetical protein
MEDKSVALSPRASQHMEPCLGTRGTAMKQRQTRGFTGTHLELESKFCACLVLPCALLYSKPELLGLSTLDFAEHAIEQRIACLRVILVAQSPVMASWATPLFEDKSLRHFLGRILLPFLTKCDSSKRSGVCVTTAPSQSTRFLRT